MNQNYTNLQKTQEKKLKLEKDNNKTQEKAIEIAKNRSDAVSKLTKKLENENRQINLLSINAKEMSATFKEFQDITGQGKFVAGLEYLDVILSSSNQNIKLFGIEVSTARKIFYGFMPPGTFRVFNQLSTIIRFTTQSIRLMSDSGEEANNIFTTLLKGFGKVSGLGKLMDSEKQLNNINKTMDILNKQKRYKIIDPQLADSALSSLQAKKDELLPKTGMKGFMRLAILGDMFEKGGALSLRKDDRQERKKNAKERFKKILKQLDLIAESSIKMLMGAGKMIVKMGMMAMRFFILFAFYAALAFIILKPIMPALKEAFNSAIQTFSYGLSQMWKGLGFVLEGVMMVFSAIFGGGTAEDLLMGLLKVAEGIGRILLGLAISVLGTLWSGLYGFLIGFGKQIGVWFENFSAGGKATGKAILQVITLAGLVVAWLFGFPMLLAGIIALAVYVGAKKLFGFKAEGGKINTPLTVVGERGPEILVGKQGSNVISNSNSRKMVGGTVNNFNITINARDTSDAELRRIADKIGQMINSKVTRSVSTTTTF